MMHGVACVLALAALCATSLCPFAPPAAAQESGSSLQEEANRLTYELVELRSRRREAERNASGLRAELEALNGRLAETESEVERLEQELSACREAYNHALRSLYKRGVTSELEIILEAGELDEMWSDTVAYDRIVASEVSTQEALEEKLGELELRKRDLKETRAKRERMAETLDTASLDARIAELEARLSEIDAALRSRSGGYARNPAPMPDPIPWSVPAPGKLLDRVPTMPPISDFEPTGVVYSGYTTCYGEEFHGSPTASGVIFNMYDFTCAHRSLPFGTWLLVTFQGRQVIVQVNDRGPFVPGRVLDLSYGAAQSIGLDGVQWTEFEVLTPRGS